MSQKTTPLYDEPDTDTDTEEATEADRRMDPELRAMGALLRILRDLDEPVKTRVVRWLADRHAQPGA